MNSLKRLWGYLTATFIRENDRVVALAAVKRIVAEAPKKRVVAVASIEDFVIPVLVIVARVYRNGPFRSL